MPAAEARIDTAHADRYIAQLCDHLDHLRRRMAATSPHAGDHGPGAHHAPPELRHIERSDGRGEIVFDWGRCVLTASDGSLIVRAEAGDEKALTRAKALIGQRLETIGHREGLTVVWPR